MNEYTMGLSILEDKEIFKQYISDLTTRQLIHRDNFDNSIDAFYYLMSDDIRNQSLSSNIIIETANIVNKLNPYISNGFRVKGDYIYETNIRVPNAKELPSIVEGLIINYNMNIFDDIFLNEAMLHIGLITSQPFEDGNHRTANLITNYNLIKQGIAPIIIHDEIKEIYDNLVYSRNLDSLANLFRELSKSESKYIHSIFINNQDINSRHY